MKSVKKPKKEVEVSFPITHEGFESLALEVVKKFGVPDSEETRELIATTILHAPGHVAACSLAIIGGSVRKGIANKVAFEKIGEFKQKRAEESAKIQEAKKLAETPQDSANVEPVQN